ncbi:MAG: hypothetical protein ABI835_02240 [Chloroflexota bacterium]
MPKLLRWILFAGIPALLVVLLLFVFVRDAQMPPAPVALPLTETFDDSPSGFTFQYPAEWRYTIPVRGVLLLGPPQTIFDGEAGPSLTVQRSDPLTVVGTLDEGLDRYLNLGPLRTQGLWQITQPVSTTTFNGRDARAVELEGSNAEGTPRLFTRVVATVADNSFVYLIITSTPAERRAAFEPTLNAILDTIQILE